MKFVALVSGGKDSTFAIAEAIAQGHELVGLAHLASFSLSESLARSGEHMDRFSIPGVSEEKDSWMYQSVGSELVPFLAVAFERPMFWVDPVSGDDFDAEEDKFLQSFGANAFLDGAGRVDRDVVRLWRLLRTAKSSLAGAPQALVSGAILSNYQRTRIEVVCRALGWVSISPLWQRPQTLLLSLMGTTAGIDARMIKTACIGLGASHLMKSLCPPKEHVPPGESHAPSHSQGAPPASNLGLNLDRLEEQYGVNVCGEGGEYESFTIDAEIWPHFRLLPLSWDVIAPSLSDSSSDSSVSSVRFTRLVLVEKASGSTYMPQSSASSLASVLVPHSASASWKAPETASPLSTDDLSRLESTIRPHEGSLTALVKELVKIGKIVIVSSTPVPSTSLPTSGIDQSVPVARNPAKAAEEAIDKLKVTGPFFRTSGAFVGSKLGISPSSGVAWPASNFYIECSHHVYEDCRTGVEHVAKDISQATQAVMNAIGRKLIAEGLSFKNIYFASLTIPSMSVFGDMNPVYSSYFVPVHNPPSRVTVAQRPRHTPTSSSSDSSSSIAPSIRVEFWGIFPQFIDKNLEPKLALPQRVFGTHNVLHVESYSEWAPACIGPYSQAHEVLGVDNLAGQIALLPAQMTLFAPPATITDPEQVLYERTLGELKWSLKHVVSLVHARSTKGGKSVPSSSPSRLLFSSMFTSVPLSLTNKCIKHLAHHGTDEEKFAVELVLKGATLIRVDQLPRLAAVEIQTAIDFPDSALYNVQDSNLTTHYVPIAQVREATTKNCFSTSDSGSGHLVFSKWNLSHSLTYAHTQHVIVSSGGKTDAASIVETARHALDSIAHHFGCSSTRPADKSPNVDLLSTHLFYESGDLDNPEYFKIARNSPGFHFTPYPAVEIGAPHTWIGDLEPNQRVVAVLHSKWALVLELDD